jgi:hypothetical protein
LTAGAAEAVAQPAADSPIDRLQLAVEARTPPRQVEHEKDHRDCDERDLQNHVESSFDERY